MYEARQNKEKVSRRIDTDSGTKQRRKMGKINMHMTAQFTSDTKGKSKKACIQLFEMQNYALRVDFNDPNRRNNYFATKTVDFFDRYHHLDDLNKPSIYDNVNGKLRLGGQEEDIQFLHHPLRDMIPYTDTAIKAKREVLKNRIKESLTEGYLSNIYTREREDSFKESLEQKLLKYQEVMFIIKDNTMFFAPNGRNNIKLSHPSLFGGYPYDVDDAGTLKMERDKIIAINDSGHYGKRGGINQEVTNKLNPPVLVDL